MFTTRYLTGKKRSRRAVIMIMAAFFLVLMAAFLAFAIDLGGLSLARTQMQNAADAAALAASAYIPSDTAKATTQAQVFAAYQKVAGKNIAASSVSVAFGSWDKTARLFVAGTPSNAVQVTIQRDATHDGQIPTFFGNIFGIRGKDFTARSVAVTNPRDICFVVDLSGSMNDDTEPCWTTDQINAKWGSTVGNDLMQKVYTDFGFGTFPETAYATSSSSDYSSDANVKTAMTNKIMQKMPNVKPTPNINDSNSKAYWKAYLQYISSSSGTNIMDYGNPQTNSYPNAKASDVQPYQNQIRYKTYVQFMMDFGRDSPVTGTQYTPLSTLNAACPKHNEVVGTTSFSFPPREMPTHAARRSIIAALQVVEQNNINIGDSNDADQVSIITFDKATSASNVTILHPLDCNYDQAMLDSTTMQAVSDIGASTSTETGLQAAINLLTASTRTHADKIVVFLTDGLPNAMSSTSNHTTITSGMSGNPSTNTYIQPNVSNYYSTSSSNDNQNAALVQIAIMQSKGWHVYPVGIGMGFSSDFMDRSARIGGTADTSGHGPAGTGDPSQYETTVKNIFTTIMNNPRAHLVQ
jgi:Flp pilus assembly protein TadG